MADVINTLSQINYEAENDTADFISAAEERYSFALDCVVERIINNKSVEIVLLAGPSCSGKTTTANKLRERLADKGHKAYTISLDDFYRNSVDAIIGDDGKPDYETVHALDLDLLEKVLKKLVKDRTAKIPRFDFDTGIRTDNAFEITLDEGDVVILEGLHALNPLIYGYLPSDALLKIYISVSTRIYDDSGYVLLTKRDLRLIRRTVRDFHSRSSSVENTFDMWDGVLEGENKYLAPYKYCADILIDTIHNYEPCVFKSRALDLFKTVEPDSVWFAETQRLTEKLVRFSDIAEENVPRSSLLVCEFLG
ncbi:MAG: nucleoside kinase [Clostridia bacterium]|nr:nucleoside kinase [Clostridia bacterium]